MEYGRDWMESRCRDRSGIKVFDTNRVVEEVIETMMSEEIGGLSF